jgi:multiple sugar transport system permease protein
MRNPMTAHPPGREQRQTAAPRRPVRADSDQPTAGHLRQPVRRRLLPLLFTGPALIVTVGVIIPWVMAIYYSFTDKSFNNPISSFTGISTWKAVLTSGDFWHGVVVTLEYGVIATAAEMLVGVCIALLLQRQSILGKIVRFITFLPLLISPAIAVIIWGVLTNPTYGLYTHWLSDIGVHTLFANSPRTALLTVILIDFWLYTPFVVILANAGLNALPREPYEAVEMDGAPWWMTFRKLTLPMLTPILIVTVVFRLMVALGEFTIIYGLTQGGPGNTLMNLPNLAYQDGFLYYNFAEAMAILLFLWVIVFVLSQVLVRWYGRVRRQASASA